MLYVIGCGRSGTKYTTALLNQLNIKVCHEKLGPDGEIGWKGLLKILDGRVDPTTNVVLHQVRNPLETISSLRTHKNGLLKNVSRHFKTNSSLNTLEGKLHRCMEYWYEWNLLAEKYAKWTYRIETISDVIEEICNEAGIPYLNKELPHINSSLNTRKTKYFARFQKEPVSWNKLESIDAKLYQQIKDLARKYGYGEEHLSDTFEVKLQLTKSKNNE